MRLRLLIPCLILMSAAVPAQQDRENAPKAEGPRLLRAGAATSNITPPLGEPIVGNWISPTGHPHPRRAARPLPGPRRRPDPPGFRDLRQRGHPPRGLRRRQDARPRRDGTARRQPADGGDPHPLGHDRPDSENPLMPDGTLTDYQRFLARRIADGIRRALNNLEPARIGWGAVDVPDAGLQPPLAPQARHAEPEPLRRRGQGADEPASRAARTCSNPPGRPTPRSPSSRSDRSTGRPIALLANYSLHYVGGVPRGHVSADYFAVFADRIGQLLGADRLDPPFVGIMSNGTSGDVNNIDFRQKAEAGRPTRRCARSPTRWPTPSTGRTRRSSSGTGCPWPPHRGSSCSPSASRPTSNWPIRRQVLAKPEGARPKHHVHERVYAERVLQLHESPGRGLDPAPGVPDRRPGHRRHPVRGLRRDRTGDQAEEPPEADLHDRAGQRLLRLLAHAPATRPGRLRDLDGDQQGRNRGVGEDRTGDPGPVRGAPEKVIRGRTCCPVTGPRPRPVPLASITLLKRHLFQRIES